MRNRFAKRALAVLLGVLLIAAAAPSPAEAVMASPRLKPPAPGPAFISRADIERVQTVREALRKKRYSDAHAAIADVENPTARTLAQWYYFEAEDPLVSISEADAYLDANPEWPSATKIQAHAEKRMSTTTPAGIVLDFFDTRDPLTGEGKVQLARAQFNAGSPEAGIFHIKDAWINDNFTLAEEQRLLSQYGGRLSADDHAARVDHLLWSHEVTNARRVFSRLTSSERRKAEARAAFLSGAKDAVRRYDALNTDEREDAGVMLAAIRYFRRTGEETRAIAIARNAPLDPVIRRNPSRWWDEQQLLMRWALKNRQYADAYAMAASHGLEAGTTEFAETEFNAGWIALRFLNDPKRAKIHFAALTASVGAPISLSRGWYWLARAEEALGETQAAREHYGKAAEHSYTFYGQLAAEKIGGPAAVVKFEESPPASPEDKAKFGARPAVAALRMLTDIGDERAFLIFAYHIDDLLETRGEFLELFDLAMKMRAPHIAVRAGKVAVRTGSFAAQIAYPAVYVPEEAARFTPVEVILGLSRQESEFNPRAYSRAGARGMMQLIPSTAQITARKERLPYSRSALLDDPLYNMTLGAAHVSHLVDRFDGSYIMTFAGYNAGVSRVEEWIDTYGDPRSAQIDPLDWMEMIPFGETRNYVQRVLENTQIYRSRNTSVPIAGNLARDIERGGPGGRIAALPAISSAGLTPEVQPRIAVIADPILNPPQQQASNSPPPPAVKTTPTPSRARPSRRSTTKSRNSTTAQSADGLTPVEPTVTNTPPLFTITPAVAAPPVRAGLTAETPNQPAEFIDNIDSSGQGVIDAADNPAGRGRSFADGDAVGGDAAKDCLTYSDFIAQTAREDASAADLNAGMLAEIQGDGACEDR